MITTLRNGKAKLSELVERASQGEDVLITVRGKVKARLTKVEVPTAAKTGATWAEELRRLQRAVSSGRRPRLSSDEILEQDREERN
jgi:prevent-host-death family protein